MPVSAWEPWPEPSAVASGLPANGGLADRALAAYQQHLRRPMPEYAKGCRFTPSCSAYAREAFAAHGAIVGFIRTANRLFWLEAVANPAEFQVLPADGYPRLYDPASTATDFEELK